MKKLILITSIAFFISPLKAQDGYSTLDLLNEYSTKMHKFNSFTYQLDYKVKFFKSSDTYYYHTNCSIIRNKSDSIFGATFWINSDSIEYYYDLNNLYLINNRKKYIKKYSPSNGEYSIFSSKPIAEVLRTYILNPEFLKKLAKDTTNSSFLVKQKNRLKSYQISFNLSDAHPIKNQKLSILFKKSLLPSRIKYQAEYLGNVQFNQWQFNGYKLDAVNTSDLTNRFNLIKSKYELKVVNKKNSQPYNVLELDNLMPSFVGIDIQSLDRVQINYDTNALTIIDFWYKDCFPCVKSTTLLNSIRRNFSEDSIKIIGLNPIDNVKENRNDLIKYKKENNIEFTLLGVDKEVQEKFRVSVFPTLYLFDHNGKLRYYELGYNADNNNLLLNKIKELQR